ncbi:hypothetical protein SODALDRAFT_312836 [Sodiomyces alkalinus F11]|uniref:Calcium uniporter protein, mitochondrial n=1 Tax=Sodiomyces alkalinus (strain CBS 110278 / VKM F-3762 / F11) TaxID=1314773 RepID=A0A3N2PUT3_SODAK|nr:hypothetical protein SODALDRAFT_312836 [Sodiomyces alkalinus F11]ROT38263.1 hypothetical protein SODALDRAFT_312836 [Sodiomyces alkalinus F11]
MPSLQLEMHCVSVRVLWRSCQGICSASATPSGPLLRCSVSGPAYGHPFLRSLAASTKDHPDTPDSRARDLNQKDVDEQEQEFVESFSRRQQNSRPWHRAGGVANKLPNSLLSLDPTNGDSTRGRLLTTPTRLLKLILPLPFRIPRNSKSSEREDAKREESKDAKKDGDNEDGIEPLALLVHPQQPLSYLERLIQAELPPIFDGRRERLPNLVFRAEGDLQGTKGDKDDESGDEHGGAIRQDDNEGNVAAYSGLGREEPARSESEAKWVRWSSSTEIGDFICDAARGREFAISIEGYEPELRVAVPSFNDRTHYMRERLRRMSRHIRGQAQIKEECDQLASKGAHRLAQGGFGALVGWWGAVYYVTFHTEAGWDLVEPVTYLVGLTTMIGGYMWFLYISRDLSYKEALNVTESRRQQALYAARGFDLGAWKELVQEANALRREIRTVAVEYDVDWEDTKDLGGEAVKEVLEREDSKDEKKRKADEEEGEEEGRRGEEKNRGRDRKAEGKQSGRVA